MTPLPHPIAFTPGTSVVRTADPLGQIMTVIARSDETAASPVHCTVTWLEAGAHSHEAEILESDLSHS